MLRAPNVLVELLKLAAIRAALWAALIVFLIVLSRVWHGVP